MVRLERMFQASGILLRAASSVAAIIGWAFVSIILWGTLTRGPPPISPVSIVLLALTLAGTSSLLAGTILLLIAEVRTRLTRSLDVQPTPDA